MARLKYLMIQLLLSIQIWLQGEAVKAPTTTDSIPILTQTNLLFIIYDDLRPELSVYGSKYVSTPNFDRLANRSVIFDKAYAQISVCNPSRDSLLTGLRPDTVRTYNFQHTYYPLLILPQQLVKSNYMTASFGKVLHGENSYRTTWNYRSWNNKWYDYQSNEYLAMNSTVMPDKVRSEKSFRDSLFVDKSLDCLYDLVNEEKYFMLAIGFKLPHLALHVPYRHYEQQKNMSQHWQLTKKELRFPNSVNEVSYQCCAESKFVYMEEEGAKKSKKSHGVGNINEPIKQRMRDELMLGYTAAISYLDEQLGRVLDAIDRLSLWGNLTIVLTADHGMHNGEKGIWEKWSLFEESTRVPLMIAHPHSPFKGQHYQYPVELIDVYPTLNDLLLAPNDMKEICKGFVICRPLQGKSLAKVVVGDAIYNKNFKKSNSNYGSTLGYVWQAVTQSIKKNSHDSNGSMPEMKMKFALSQKIRCADRKKLEEYTIARSTGVLTKRKGFVWGDCDLLRKPQDVLAVMGYSMRTIQYRYTSYYYYNLSTSRPELSSSPYSQELYYHGNDTDGDNNQAELYNLATKPTHGATVSRLHEQLTDFIRSKVSFSHRNKS